MSTCHHNNDITSCSLCAHEAMNPHNQVSHDADRRALEFLNSLSDEDRKKVEDNEKFGHFSDLVRSHLSPGFVLKSMPLKKL